MLSQRLANHIAARGIHYGWVVVAVTFLTALSSAAALGLPGALLQPLSHEFGWSVDQISTALAVRFALFGLMGPFAAILMERFGMRNVMVTALMTIAFGLALVRQMHAFWQLVLLLGVMLGLGSGMTALVLNAVVSSRWFEQRRGLVMGLLTASSATGQLVFLPIGTWLIEHAGWRTALLPVMGSCALVAVAALLLVRDHPQDLGLLPYGAGAAAPMDVPIRATSPARMRVSPATPFRVLASVRGDRVFWVLFASFFICGLSTNGLIQSHFISLCGDAGLSAVPAASVLAMMGAFDLVGTILSGWLSDRYDSRWLLCWYYALRGLSLAWLPSADFTLYGLSLFAMFYGLDWIATVPPTVRLAGQAFGSARAPMVFGWIFAGHQLGAAVAAYGAGRIRTLTLSYDPAVYAAAAACAVAALLVLGWIFAGHQLGAVGRAAGADGTAHGGQDAAGRYGARLVARRCQALGPLRQQQHQQQHACQQRAGRGVTAQRQAAAGDRLVEEVADRRAERPGQDESSPEQGRARDTGAVDQDHHQRQARREQHRTAAIAESPAAVGVRHPVAERGAERLREQDREPVEQLGLARVEPLDRYRPQAAPPAEQGQHQQREQQRRAARVADSQRAVAQVGQRGADRGGGDDRGPEQQGMKALGA
jgi:sugar phosphate permease